MTYLADANTRRYAARYRARRARTNPRTGIPRARHARARERHRDALGIAVGKRIGALAKHARPEKIAVVVADVRVGVREHHPDATFVLAHHRGVVHARSVRPVEVEDGRVVDGDDVDQHGGGR